MIKTTSSLSPIVPQECLRTNSAQQFLLDGEQPQNTKHEKFNRCLILNGVQEPKMAALFPGDGLLHLPQPKIIFYQAKRVIFNHG